MLYDKLIQGHAYVRGPKLSSHLIRNSDRMHRFRLDDEKLKVLVNGQRCLDNLAHHMGLSFEHLIQRCRVSQFALNRPFRLVMDAKGKSCQFSSYQYKAEPVAVDAYCFCTNDLPFQRTRQHGSKSRKTIYNRFQVRLVFSEHADD